MNKVKRRKIASTVIDLFVFSLFLRMLLFLQIKTTSYGYQWKFLAAYLIAGIIVYVLIPCLFGFQTIGMKINRLFFISLSKQEAQKLPNSIILRSLFVLVSNIILLGIPFCLNVFLILWNKEGKMLQDYLFKDVMMIESCVVLQKERS